MAEHPAQRSAFYTAMGASLLPDRARGIDHELELGALVRFAQWIAGGAAGEAALRADGKPIKIDMPRRLVDTAPQRVQAFELRGLAADKAEHHALALGHKGERREIARPRRVVFQQEVIG